MFQVARLKLLARIGLVHGPELHRAGLAAIHAGRFAEAEALLDLARRRYRRELEVEALARLRVHQLMERVLAGAGDHEAEWCLEVERHLGQLDRIESLAPPFDLVDAHSMIANWMARDGATVQDSAEDPESGLANAA